MKKVFLSIAGISFSSIFALIVAEGIYSLWMADRYQTSISYQAYSWVKNVFSDDSGIHEWDPNTRTITSSHIFEDLLEYFLEDGVALGNSYYSELRTDKASMNTTEQGCKVQKPNLDKEMTYLRAGLYAPFAWVTAFYDKEAELHSEVVEFIERYGTRRIRHRTNEWGERLTLPKVNSSAKVLIAGDSVANGAMLNDEETLASRLQALDSSRQYVNIGIGGADASDILCALKRAMKRYSKEVKRLIYIYCENDFKDDKKWGQPEEVVSWLKKFVSDESIEEATIIYAPYIYNIVPHITRFRGGYRGGRYETHGQERRRLEQLTVAAGFEYVDMGELALKAIDESGTQFGALLLFSDRAHWSPIGTARMAEFLLKE